MASLSIAAAMPDANGDHKKVVGVWGDVAAQ